MIKEYPVCFVTTKDLNIQKLLAGSKRNFEDVKFIFTG